MIEINRELYKDFPCIYGLINSCNKKIYVGSTQDLHQRLLVHKSMSKKDSYMPICKAIKEHGWENFELEILEIVFDMDNIHKIESDYIKKYKSEYPEFGYNTPVGRTKRKVKCIETGIIYESEAKAAKELKIAQSSIGRCCMNSYGFKTAGGFHWEFINEKNI